MGTIPAGVLEDIQQRARTMLTEGNDFTVFCAPGGNRMFDITTDQQRLKTVVTAINVDGQRVFIGERAK